MPGPEETNELLREIRDLLAVSGQRQEQARAEQKAYVEWADKANERAREDAYWRHITIMVIWAAVILAALFIAYIR